MVANIPQSILDIEIPEEAQEEALQYPTIRDKKDIAALIEPIYIIHNYMVDDETYDALKDEIYDIVKASFEIKECREYPVKFKFYPKDNTLHTLQLRHFLINLFLWGPLIEVHPWMDVMDDGYILDCFNHMNNKDLVTYLNDYPIRTLIDHACNTSVMNHRIADTLYDLTSISNNFSSIMNLTFGMETFQKMWDNSAEYRELATTVYPSTAQPNEIEKDLDKKTKQMIDLFKADPTNPIGHIFGAGGGIKPKQFCEFTINGGCNPDLSGKTIPQALNTNTLMGIHKASQLHISAMGARKSLIMNKKVMGKAGYFGKIVLLLALTIQLSRKVHDCGSKHYYRAYITSRTVLDKYHNRYYKINEDDCLHVLNSKKDLNLIGKTILLRSPAKCCSSDGCICHVCYGKNAMLALDIADGAPGFGSQEITKVINQMILSAKHLLTTISEEIQFTDKFYDFFTLVNDEIIPSISDSPIEDINDWAIYINPKDIALTDEMDDATSSNTSIPSGIFYVKNLKTQETHQISSSQNKELFLTDVAIEMTKKFNGIIKFKDISDSDCIFTIDIMNNELTKPLYDIMNLLNRKRDREYTIDEMADYFTGLLVQSGIGAHSLQAELILRALVRNSDDVMHYPDFGHVKEPSYTILTVEQAIKNNPSPLLGLAFQDLKEQILSDQTFYEKDGSTFLDDLFKKKVKFKKYDQ